MIGWSSKSVDGATAPAPASALAAGAQVPLAVQSSLEHPPACARSASAHTDTIPRPRMGGMIRKQGFDTIADLGEMRRA